MRLSLCIVAVLSSVRVFECAAQGLPEKKLLNQLPTASAIVPLDLNRQITRVRASHGKLPARDLRLDIGLSEELMEWPRATNAPQVVIVPARPKPRPPIQYVIVAENIRMDESCHVAFVSGLTRCKVGMVVRIVVKHGRASAEVEPMAFLPSGNKISFSSTGMRDARAVLNAALQLPVPRRDHSNSQVVVLDLSGPTADSQTLDELAQYAMSIHDRSSVYLRFHAQDKTYPAEVATKVQPLDMKMPPQLPIRSAFIRDEQ